MGTVARHSAGGCIIVHSSRAFGGPLIVSEGPPPPSGYSLVRTCSSVAKELTGYASAHSTSPGFKIKVN